MTMQVSPTSPPMLPVVTPQVAASTNRFNQVKPTAGVSAASVPAKHHSPTNVMQPTQTLPVALHRHESSLGTPNATDQNGSAATILSTAPLSVPPSGGKSIKCDLTPAASHAEGSCLPQDGEGQVSGISSLEEEKQEETVLAKLINQLWSSLFLAL